MPPFYSVPADVKERYKSLREDIVKLDCAVIEAQKNGDESTAKFKMMLRGDVKEKIDELEGEHPGLLTMTEPEPVPTPAPVPSPSPAVKGPMSLLAKLKQLAEGRPAVSEGPAAIPESVGVQEDPSAKLKQMCVPMNFTQQQAIWYDQQKASNRELEVEVKDLQAKYQLQDRHMYQLNEMLKGRNNTFDDDLWAIDEILKHCGNTVQVNDLLITNMRWMQEGKFCGAYSPNPEVIKAAKKFGLDPPAACKLARALEDREDADVDMERIVRHLERSSKPSSQVMMFLKTLKAGEQIPEDYRGIAVGSWLHKQEQNQRGDDRDAKHGGGRSRSKRGSRRKRDDHGGRDDYAGSGGRDDYGGRGGRDDYGGRGGRDDYGGRGGRDNSAERSRRDARGGQRDRDRPQGGNESRGRRGENSREDQSWQGSSGDSYKGKDWSRQDNDNWGPGGDSRSRRRNDSRGR